MEDLLSWTIVLNIFYILYSLWFWLFFKQTSHRTSVTFTWVLAGSHRTISALTFDITKNGDQIFKSDYLLCKEVIWRLSEKLFMISIQLTRFLCQCRIQQFFWGGAGFLTSAARRKTVVQLGSLGGGRRGHCKPVPVGSRKFWLFCILNSLHQKSTLLRVWESEFGIPNWYTSFKIALDMTLSMKHRSSIRSCKCMKKWWQKTWKFVAPDF